MKDKRISIRVDSDQLKRLQETLGLDDSKTIRACMNCTEFVIHRWFGGDLRNIFRRKPTNETQDLYRLG